MKFLFHLVLAFCLFICASPANAALTLIDKNPSWKAHIFLAAQMKGVGLMDSYVQDNQNLSYVYDNALAAMAFIAEQNYGLAAKILDALANGVQRTPGGALYESYNFMDINGSGQGQVMAGNTAWVLQAMNLYQKNTGSQKYTAFQKTLADYLVSQQDLDGGIFIMPGNRVKSTEHNMAAYVALFNYGKLQSSHLHQQAAEKVKSFLVTFAWFPWQTRFRTSVPDPLSFELLTWVTDVQALGVLALGDTYKSALTWVGNRLVTAKTITGTSTTLLGFDFNYDVDTIWLEGTLQMALAYSQAGMTIEAKKYSTEVLKAQNPDGSLLLCTNTGTASVYWTLQPWHAVAPTAWLVFYDRNFNPLQKF